MNKYLIILVLIFTTACRNKVVQYPVSYDNDRERFMQFSQDLNKQILHDETEQIEEYIADSKMEFNHTSYGFWISNSGKSTPTMAKSGDAVKYNYEVSDFDGNVIYSEQEIGTRQSLLGKENLPRGLHIGLQLIEKGDSAIALMPSFLAYGGYGDRNRINGNEPLIFKIKIFDIKKR